MVLVLVVVQFFTFLYVYSCRILSIIGVHAGSLLALWLQYFLHDMHSFLLSSAFGMFSIVCAFSCCLV